ncbi:hypothetical protein J1N35_041642 [Gossypium stocksii]|uniref:Uncharacterized protein n=1 Tax=Gossypium stocksii TaxID=47602 RepID=A0A9D3ZJW9_9ROSI|nr:hypothetical protein J1N35_041642 [Gossypium stocksii]
MEASSLKLLYLWSKDQHGYKERSSSTNEDSMIHWIYDSDYGRQESSFEHPYGLYGYATEMGSYNQGWSNNYPTYDSYSPYYYLEINMENVEFMEDPSLTTLVGMSRVGMLVDNMSSCQATMFSMSNTLEQILEADQFRAKINTLVGEVKHEVPELK